MTSLCVYSGRTVGIIIYTKVAYTGFLHYYKKKSLELRNIMNVYWTFLGSYLVCWLRPLAAVITEIPYYLRR